MGHDYLLEIGCEEIPPGFVGPALWYGGQKFAEVLKKGRLSFDRVDIYGTPRRLTYIVRELEDRQKASEETVLGPPKSVAFDASGKPTKAAEGFAKGQGVPVSELKLFQTDRGEYLGIVKEEAARPVEEILPQLVSDWIPTIPFKKTMRWADLDVRFARPVHWIVSLFGEKIIPLTFGIVTAGNTTYGHRFLAPDAIPLSSPEEYFDKLSQAKVFVDLEVRKEKIRTGIRDAERQIGRKWVEDEPLVETVANLVEYPVVLVGRFEEKYLALPREILITSMRTNQKYFVFEDDRGNLFPGFAFVSNMIVPDNQVVVTGNERVIRARLSDAEFYYQDDLKQPLFDRAQALKNVLFQADLGTYWEKVERMAEIGAYVASTGFPAKEQECRRAAVLSKADLTTGVVKEFPELQGVMGRDYARKTGEKEETAQAVFEHYLPKGMSDEMPGTDVGAAVAIADKVDMVCGCFGVGLIPTGTADPYGLRRQTLGILSILESKGLRIPLSELVDRSLATLGGKLKSPAGEVKRRTHRHGGHARETLRPRHVPPGGGLRTAGRGVQKGDQHLQGVCGSVRRVGGSLRARGGAHPSQGHPGCLGWGPFRRHEREVLRCVPRDGAPPAARFGVFREGSRDGERGEGEKQPAGALEGPLRPVRLGGGFFPGNRGPAKMRNPEG
jgi:glycyl-tRNA synthetase beta chain